MAKRGRAQPGTVALRGGDKRGWVSDRCRDISSLLPALSHRKHHQYFDLALPLLPLITHPSRFDSACRVEFHSWGKRRPGGGETIWLGTRPSERARQVGSIGSPSYALFHSDHIHLKLDKPGSRLLSQIVFFPPVSVIYLTVSQRERLYTRTSPSQKFTRRTGDHLARPLFTTPPPPSYTNLELSGYCIRPRGTESRR